jgi:hypothetical protein
MTAGLRGRVLGNPGVSRAVGIPLRLVRAGTNEVRCAGNHERGRRQPDRASKHHTAKMFPHGCYYPARGRDSSSFPILSAGGSGSQPTTKARCHRADSVHAEL